MNITVLLCRAITVAHVAVLSWWWLVIHALNTFLCVLNVGKSLVVGYKMAAGGPLWTYHTSDQLFTCDCHPTEPITVAGTVTGDIHL